MYVRVHDTGYRLNKKICRMLNIHKRDVFYNKCSFDPHNISRKKKYRYLQFNTNVHVQSAPVDNDLLNLIIISTHS